MRISTLLSPNSAMRGARSEAHDGSGVSRVPRRASVSIDTRSAGFFRNASRIVDIWNFILRKKKLLHPGRKLTSSCSVLPMYKVER
jgi:hypothetical protein